MQYSNLSELHGGFTNLLNLLNSSEEVTPQKISTEVSAFYQSLSSPNIGLHCTSPMGYALAALIEQHGQFKGSVDNWKQQIEVLEKDLELMSYAQEYIKTQPSKATPPVGGKSVFARTDASVKDEAKARSELKRRADKYLENLPEIVEAAIFNKMPLLIRENAACVNVIRESILIAKLTHRRELQTGSSSNSPITNIIDGSETNSTVSTPNTTTNPKNTN